MVAIRVGCRTRGRRDVCPMLKAQMACEAISDKAACEASTACEHLTLKDTPGDDGSCESAAGAGAIMALVWWNLGDSRMRCQYMKDATECVADTDCELKGGECGPNMVTGLQSVTDPNLKMLMTTWATCSALKGAACSANSNCMLNEEDGKKTEDCGMGEGVMKSLATKCGITMPGGGSKPGAKGKPEGGGAKPEGGGEGAKGDACKGRSHSLPCPLIPHHVCCCRRRDDTRLCTI